MLRPALDSLGQSLLAIESTQRPASAVVEVVHRRAIYQKPRCASSIYIAHCGLDIAVLRWREGCRIPYLNFQCQLVLIAAETMQAAINAGTAAALLYRSPEAAADPEQIRIAFDGDAVISRTRLSVFIKLAASKLSNSTSVNHAKNHYPKALSHRLLLAISYFAKQFFRRSISAPIRTAQ